MTKKIYQGAIKNRERTKQKFLDAVGEIVRSKGCTGLGVNKIARQAGMNKSLIYSYFGDVKSLIQQYVRSKDFWISSTQSIEDFIEKNNPEKIELVKFILSNQMDSFSSNIEMQRFIAWQISERSQIMNEVAIAREKIGMEYFSLTDQVFSGKTDFRAVSAIFVSSIYYLTMFSKNNSSTFCEIDLAEENGFDRIKNAMFNILELLEKKELDMENQSQ